MTIEQGNEINALYLGYNKTIDSLKIKSRYYDSAINQISKKQDTINLYRYHISYIKPTAGTEELKEIYEKEKAINRMWSFVLFMALALIKSQ
jgi:5'-deoxynucleotidase YfbR-like HD superfamily hydrolase